MIALRQAWRAAEPRGWSVSQRVSWGQGAEGLAQALSGAWLIFIMSSIQALPRTFMDVFNFSLRAGGRPHWTQRPKCRSAHSHRPDFCGMSSAWPARCLSCQAPNCGKPCVSQDWLVTLLASSSEGALSTSMEAEVKPWPETALLSSSWSLRPVRSVLPPPRTYLLQRSYRAVSNMRTSCS